MRCVMCAGAVGGGRASIIIIALISHILSVCLPSQPTPSPPSTSTHTKDLQNVFRIKLFKQTFEQQGAG